MTGTIVIWDPAVGCSIDDQSEGKQYGSKATSHSVCKNTKTMLTIISLSHSGLRKVWLIRIYTL